MNPRTISSRFPAIAPGWRAASARAAPTSSSTRRTRDAAIRALPPDEFYYVIHELGFPEAMEVLVHGTAEQVQTVLDFSIWDRDRVALDKSDDWLAALVEAPPETLGKWAQGIDVELLALLLRKRARIYDLSLEEAPDKPRRRAVGFARSAVHPGVHRRARPGPSHPAPASTACIATRRS